MVIVGFQVQDTLEKARFFHKTFMLANISMKVVFRIFFFTFSKVNIDFTNRKFTKRAYTAEKTLSSIKKIWIINSKEFVKVALDSNKKVFVVYIPILSFKITIHLVHKT